MELLPTLLAVVASLMLACCLGLFLQPLASFWGKRPWRAQTQSMPELEERQTPRYEVWVRLALVMLLSRIAIYLLGYLLHGLAFGREGPFFQSMESTWSRSDAPHYLDIAREGYQSAGEDAVFLVFFPGYPWLVRIFWWVLGDAFASGLLVSNVASILSAISLYELCRLDMDRSAALRSVKYAFIMPAAFFYSAPFSESIFLLFCLWCVLGIRKKRWFLGCLCGGLAALTRSLGVLLAVVAVAELGHEAAYGNGFRHWRTWLHALCILLIPAGLGAYLLLNYAVSGNALQFLVYQREHWSQEFGTFFASIRNIAEMAIQDVFARPDMTFALWLPELLSIFACLLLMITMPRRLRPSYTAFAIVYFIVAIAPTWLLSAPRYLLPLFPLAMALGGITQKRAADILLTCVMCGGFLLFMTAYLGSMPIF